MKKNLFVLVAVVGSMSTAICLAQSSARAEWEGGRLSVSAQGATLSRVLQEVAAKTHVRFRGLERLQNCVYVNLSNLDLTEALAELLSDSDYAIVGDASRPGHTSPTLVIIFGQHAGPRRREEYADRSQFENTTRSAGKASSEGLAFAEAAEPEVESDHSGVETNPEQRLVDLMKSAQQGDRGALQEGVMDPDPTVQASAFEALAAQDKDGAIDALLSALKSDQPATRLEALQLLDQSKAEERITLPALRDALRDDDQSVRTYAVQALANAGGSEAVDQLRQAIHDADPSFRLMAVSVVAQRDEGGVLLREALNDPDESVSSSAALLLQETESKEK